MQAQTTTGIPGIPEVPWGTHYCHFYDSHRDLADMLVPYFKAGLDGNDACLWVTSAPLRVVDARAALAAVTPDLVEREARGQIEIIDHEDWYLRTGNLDAISTLEGWIAREHSALARGYTGLRLNGNTCWLERSDWDSFVAYERLVNETFRNHRILGLCSYCLDRCSGHDVLDVVENHQFTVVRRDSSWQVVEAPAIELARQDLFRVQQAASALRLADQHKDQFIAMLGHELRNPLAPIATAVDLMRFRDRERHARELDIIDRQLRHLTTLVDDLLDVSRIARGMVELRTRPTRITDVLARALELVSSLVERRQHRLDLQDRSDGAIIDGDADRLVQVLGNVIGNAVKYTPSGGEIEIETVRDGERVRVTIRDNGPGIPAAVLPHVFELFVQGEPALDRRDSGLGLGLPIVKSLVELHRGSVELASSDTGTTVTITLPIATAAHVWPEAEPCATPQPIGEGHRLLIVDDNEDAATLLGQFFEEMRCEVRVVAGAQDALAIAGSWRPDIAILDIGLPGMNGYELARRLRAIPGLQQLRLIAVTGYGPPADLQRVQQCGFDHYLTKPVRMATLESVLRD